MAGAGYLRDVVTFQRRGAQADGYGNSTVGAWAAITGCSAVRAGFRSIRQNEQVGPEGVTGRATYEVTVRQSAELLGLSVKDRMVHDVDGRTFNIKSPPVNVDQRGRFLRILVEQGGADG